MFGQLLPNKNKILQYNTVPAQCFDQPRIGQLNETQDEGGAQSTVRVAISHHGRAERTRDAGRQRIYGRSSPARGGARPRLQIPRGWVTALGKGNVVIVEGRGGRAAAWPLGRRRQ
jgi:hypothetical protein